MKDHRETYLISGLKNGDEKAFRLIFDEFYRPLTLFAVKYLSDIDEAQEVVQELFVRVWSKRETLEIRFSLKMYLYQSTRNACVNYLETNKVAQRRRQQLNPAVITNEDPLENMIAAEQEETLMRAIDNLPEKCREIFLMSRMEKLTNQAIANQLNISIKTVEAQISIALKRLSTSMISLLFAIFFL